jgi:DNA-binding transcriptional ArsR family regulator
MPAHRARPKTRMRRSVTLIVALRVIRCLVAEPWTIYELADHLGISVKTAYRTLAALEQALGLHLEPMREGPRMLYRIRPPEIKRALGLR